VLDLLRDDRAGRAGGTKIAETAVCSDTLYSLGGALMHWIVAGLIGRRRRLLADYVMWGSCSPVRNARVRHHAATPEELKKQMAANHAQVGGACADLGVLLACAYQRQGGLWCRAGAAAGMEFRQRPSGCAPSRYPPSVARVV